MQKGIKAFSSSDVTKLVGITPIYLNALVQRKLYGIRASVSDRHGEIKVRIFSEEDVFGIALVWVLFESGLRTQSIRDILLQFVDTDEPDPNAVADFLSREPAHLVIIRAQTKPKGKARTKQWLKVEPTLTEDVGELVAESVTKYPTATILLVPVGAKFADVEKKIRLMYGE